MSWQKRVNTLGGAGEQQDSALQQSERKETNPSASLCIPVLKKGRHRLASEKRGRSQFGASLGQGEARDAKMGRENQAMWVVAQQSLNWWAREAK